MRRLRDPPPACRVPGTDDTSLPGRIVSPRARTRDRSRPRSTSPRERPTNPRDDALCLPEQVRFRHPDDDPPGGGERLVPVDVPRPLPRIDGVVTALVLDRDPLPRIREVETRDHASTDDEVPVEIRLRKSSVDQGETAPGLGAGCRLASPECESANRHRLAAAGHAEAQGRVAVHDGVGIELDHRQLRRHVHRAHAIRIRHREADDDGCR